MRTSFAIGDCVEWASQSHGSRTTKRGEVRYIVPPGVPLYQALNADRDTRFDTRALDGDGRARSIESYVILVTQPSMTKRGRKPKLYWPRVDALRKAK